MENILLPNRDNCKVCLKFLKSSNNLVEYLLEATFEDGEDAPIWIHRDKRTICGVDPCGGPFICLGYVIDNLEVKKIKNTEQGIIIYCYENKR